MEQVKHVKIVMINIKILKITYVIIVVKYNNKCQNIKRLVDFVLIVAKN